MPRPRPLLAAWFLLAALPAMACRYSVRDTGFVDLGAAPWPLVLQLEPGNDPLAVAYRQAAAEALNDANLAFTSQSDAAPGKARLFLSDPAGRSLDLAETGRLPTDPAAIRRLIESAAISPRREDIHREALRAYAIVVLVEGTDEVENARVRSLAEAATTTIGKRMVSMPKPVDVPPQVMSIPVAQQAAESVLLWGLGLSPQPAPETRLAIVYGRGRRLGAPMEGAVITRTALQERLALIGQDCECDLDRAWLKGPVLPGRWDRDLQQLAARTLGFDPENPLVRTEVSRIVLRGEGDNTRQRKTSSVLGLGYTEESVDVAAADTSAAGEDSTETAPATNSPASSAKAAATRTNPSPSQTAPLRPPAAAAPAESGSPNPETARTLWMVLGGALSAAVATGAWVALRGSRRL